MAMISATGTVEPEQVVDIGAQVNGLLIAFGTDDYGKLIDYGSEVKQGTVLAQIDDTLYVAAVNIDKAQLEQARANLVNAKANVLQMKAKLWEAEADWHRARKLGPGQSLAPTTYDQYKANYDEAVANLAVAVAQVDMAAAAVSLAEATLVKDEKNLAFCTVKSPVAVRRSPSGKPHEAPGLQRASPGKTPARSNTPAQHSAFGCPGAPIARASPAARGCVLPPSDVSLAASSGLFSEEWKSSASRNVQPSCAASCEPTVDLPASPATPIMRRIMKPLAKGKCVAGTARSPARKRELR